MIESHVSRDFNGSAADDKKIEIHTEQLIPSSNGCPEMYTLSKDNKLCYFIAKTHVKGATIGFRRLPYVIDALLVNKSDAVQFCKFHSNGTLPYGKLKNPLFALLFYFLKIEIN